MDDVNGGTLFINKNLNYRTYRSLVRYYNFTDLVRIFKL